MSLNAALTILIEAKAQFDWENSFRQDRDTEKNEICSFIALDPPKLRSKSYNHRKT